MRRRRETATRRKQEGPWGQSTASMSSARLGVGSASKQPSGRASVLFWFCGGLAPLFFSFFPLPCPRFRSSQRRRPLLVPERAKSAAAGGQVSKVPELGVTPGRTAANNGPGFPSNRTAWRGAALGRWDGAGTWLGRPASAVGSRGPARSFFALFTSFATSSHLCLQLGGPADRTFCGACPCIFCCGFVKDWICILRCNTQLLFFFEYHALG